MLTKRGRFFSHYSVIACDGRCDKAWGINGRPKLYFMEEGEPPRVLQPGERPRDENDDVYWKDSELGVAPGPGETRGISEGGDCKPSAVPLTDSSRMNKWCIRECERCEAFRDGDTIVLRDLENPQPNVKSRVWPPKQQTTATRQTLAWFEVDAPKETLVALLDWLRANDVLPLPMGPAAYGPSKVSCVFTDNDAARVTEWLVTHGVIVKDE